MALTGNPIINWKMVLKHEMNNKNDKEKLKDLIKWRDSLALDFDGTDDELAAYIVKSLDRLSINNAPEEYKNALITFQMLGEQEQWDLVEGALLVKDFNKNSGHDIENIYIDCDELVICLPNEKDIKISLKQIRDLLYLHDVEFDREY